MKTPPDFKWTQDQSRAIAVLREQQNCFLTGGAGTGKSTVIREWRKELAREMASDEEDDDAKENSKSKKSDKKSGIAVLASTGTAAILLGGRTFHSFFGLGIMEGGIDAVVERALKHKGVSSRLKKTKLVLIDEISMIGGQEWEAAEQIARKVKGKSLPWGGIRIIAVGDFAQLPPVTKPWCFLSEKWGETDFAHLNLKTIVRSKDSEWNEVLNELRWGSISANANMILKARVKKVGETFQGTRLFARRNQVDRYNQERLNHLAGTVKEYPSVYMGVARKVDEIKRQAPIPEVLVLKEGAIVMFRHNDPEQRWVNGTLGTIAKMGKEEIDVVLLSGRRVSIEPVTFSLLDAEGNAVATATNFPLNLAWACTIHKAQGATLDQVHVDLSGAWEHGQGYVALSRVRKLEDLTLEGWSPGFVKIDPVVRRFYDYISESDHAPDELDLNYDASSLADLDF